VRRETDRENCAFIFWFQNSYEINLVSFVVSSGIEKQGGSRAIISANSVFGEEFYLDRPRVMTVMLL